jgi:hypothetical protein
VDINTFKINYALRLTKGIHQSLFLVRMLVQPIKFRWQNLSHLYIWLHTLYWLVKSYHLSYYRFYLGELCSLNVLEAFISFTLLFVCKFILLGRFRWKRGGVALAIFTTIKLWLNVATREEHMNQKISSI